MKRLEIRMYIDTDETQTDTSEVIHRIDTEIDDIIGGVVKRVDLIDETEI